MKVEPVYVNEVIYLNNSPHVVKSFVINPQGEKVLMGQKVYKPVTGNMTDEQFRKLFNQPQS